MTPIRILIADDHAVFRRSLRTLIESRPDWQVCAEAVDGMDAVQKTKELRPDIVLMDVSMPRMNGLDATRLIIQGMPGSKIVIVSQNEPQLEKAVREAGAKRFVSKSNVAQELIRAVDDLVNNDPAPARGRKSKRPPDAHQALDLINVRGTELLASDPRKRHRQKLARITLDSMVQFVGLLDANGTVLEINHVALDAVGIKLSDVEGKPFWTTFWWQVSDEINATLRDSIRRAAEGEFVRWDAEIYGRAGGKETIIIDASLMPVKDEHGKVVFITAEGRDITEKKAHEREIARQREELARLDELKTQFFANISHEFRTPLTLMMGPLEDVMARPEELSAANRERMELAHRNSLRLLKLVNALLDFSRIEAGRIQASYQPTDLATFTAELASLFRSAIERAGVRLVVDCPPIGDLVYVDREMWEKIVLNLLSNAFKFTLAGEIEVSLQKAGEAVELTVRDTGTGIPAEDVPHLFERFYRVEGALGRTFEGSGIGLALVQELAKLHGGTVRVNSELRRGSTFVVTVPLGDGHLPADRIGTERTLASTASRGEAFVQEALRWLPEDLTSSLEVPALPLLASSDPASSGVQSRERARILLADDNADMRDYVRRLLRGQYEVLAVADGEAALSSAREWRPHLILSDVMMPRLDGFGLLKAVRADESLRNVPVILLSARAGEEARLEGLSSGADDYLIKPFSARELQVRVASHIAIARLRSDSAEVERKLRLDAEMLAAIVASSDDAIVSKNLDGFITSWNEGAERIFGYTAEEAIGQHITLIIPADRRDEEVDFLSRLRRGERVDHYQTVRIRKDGTPLDISASISPLRDPTGRVIGASKVARDITRQKRAEAALRQSEQRLRALVNASSYIVYRMTADWKEMRQLDGRGSVPDAGSPTTAWLESYIHPSDRRLVERAIQEATRTKTPFELEHRIRRPDGTTGWTLSRAVPLLDENGEITEWFGAASDITRHKQVEETLRQNRERFDLVTSAAKVGFWFCDLPFDKLDWDRRVKEHFWLPPEAEVTIQTFYDRLHPDDREPTRQAITYSNENDAPYDIEYRTVSADGREKWIRAMGRTFYDEAGRPKRFDGVTLDITTLKRAEEGQRRYAETLEAEVRARTKELEERNADVLRQSEQLRDLSWRLLRTQDEERRHIARELHDSAGQTLAVLGMSLMQFVQKIGINSPELAADAGLIQETVQQLSREIRTASYLLHPPLLDETGLASALNWYVQGLTERSGLEVKLDISNDVRRLPREVELTAFRLVQECLTNIHRHSGSKTATIRVAREQDLLTIEVQDQGKGMSPERLAEIQSKGSGVGILGIRERLRQLHGEMGIESSPAGTQIFVTIPIPPTVGQAPEKTAEAMPTV